MKKKTSKLLLITVAVFSLLLGCICGLVSPFYIMSDHFHITTDELNTENVFYSKTVQGQVGSAVIGEGDLAIHFLELGNKYTGDCVLIQTGNVDVLIDCGSKSSSISTVSNYINQYVTDNTLEYVIITHAHQDHYAGFATTKVDTIFDLYECETIIKFAQTNQKENAKTYSAFKSELNDEISQGAKCYTALECVENQNGAKQKYELAPNIELEILDHKYYREKASSENDYSVCAMINYGEKHYLFTGDLEKEGEESLAENYKNKYGVESVNVEVYKAGHHGSGTSSTTEFLKVFKPKIVCVCCCAGSSEYTDNSDNQFPTQEFINNVFKYAEAVYVTTLCVDYKNNIFTSFNGNIVVVSNPEVYNVYCSNNTTSLQDTEWFKNNRTMPV